MLARQTLRLLVKTRIFDSSSENSKPSSESAPRLFDLTTLQREANKKYKLSAADTLKIAQSLYEHHKVTTYPRTDASALPEDYVEPAKQILADLNGTKYEAFAQRAIRSDWVRPNKRIFDNAKISDHFAIIPTGSLPETVLTGDDKRLFDLVVRRFLGAFHPPAVWERVERVSEVAGESFRTRARFLQEKGWRAVLPAASDEEAGEVTLRPLLPGENEASGVPVALAQAETSAEQTKPPPRITEARLLSLMENAGNQIEDEDLAAVLHEKGIGTPATRAGSAFMITDEGYAALPPGT